MQHEPSPPGASPDAATWSALTDTLDIGVLGTDRDRTVLRANPAATALLGLAPVGRDLLDVLAGSSPGLSLGDLSRVGRDRVPLQRSVLLRRGRSTVRRDVRIVAMVERGVVTGFAVRVIAPPGGDLTPDPDRFDDAAEAAGDLTVGRVTVDLTTRVLRVDGRSGVVRLTGREFELLCELMRHPGRLRSRTSLLRSVWRIDFPTSTSVVDVTMSRLRAKTGLAELSTHRSDGYAFDVTPVAAQPFGPVVVTSPSLPPVP